MAVPEVRRVRFDLSGVPFQWQPENPDFGHMTNAVSVLAIAFERYIVAAVRRAQPLITDPEVAAEAEVFLQQEAQHAAAHRRHLRALIASHPELQQTVDRAIAAYDTLLDEQPLEFHLAYIADLEATFTPIFKLMLDHHDELFRPGDERVASVFLWHFVEEVEHRSSALVIYRALVDDARHRLKVLPAVVRHVLGVYSGAVRGFDEHVPVEARRVEAARVLPGRMWRREAAVRVPLLRRRVRVGGYGTPFEGASVRELLVTVYRLVLSQAPGHDPTHQPTPRFADDWFAGYGRGGDVAHWYSAARAG